jgi:Uma2 family endonuclease
MASAASATRFETLADVLERLGGINPRRVRLHPTPGKATERDVLNIHARTDRLYELVDGVLVEKVMGYPEAMLTVWLAHLLQGFLDTHDLGILAGADGTVRLMQGLVRIPDLSFISWDRLPGRKIPAEPIPQLAPDLAIEVLSKGNTKKEMQRKLREYFLTGVRRVWFVDPKRRTVEVFTAPDQSVLLTEDQTLDGGDVLPGLVLPVCKIFARLPPSTETSNSRKTSRQHGKRKPRKS